MTGQRKVMSVGDYAKYRGQQPQLVHYYVRKGTIEVLKCECCGAKVINVEQADEAMKLGGESR